MELAQLTRPYARSYALEQLAKAESDPIDRAHRALNDARAVQSLFLALISDLADMDPTLLAQFRRLSDRSGWEIAALLESAREFASPYPSRSRSMSASGIDEGSLAERLSQPPPLRAVSETAPIDPYAVAEALSYGSGFADSVPDFEERPQQIEMGTAVAETINSGGRLMVEGGNRRRQVARLPAARRPLRARQRQARRNIHQHHQPPGTADTKRPADGQERAQGY